MVADRALRESTLAGPADAYHMMGSLGLLTGTLQRALDELADWLREEERHREMTVVDGPFANDPEAAVNVAVQSLVEATLGCVQVFDALERAHIVMAHVGAEQRPATRPAGRSLWRRRT